MGGTFRADWNSDGENAHLEQRLLHWRIWLDVGYHSLGSRLAKKC